MRHRPQIAPFIVVIIGIILAACGPSGPGVDTAVDIQGGTIRVVNVERAESITQGTQTVQARPDQEFLLITTEFKAASGSTTGAGDALTGGYSIVDANGTSYPVTGLVNGALLFEVPKPIANPVLHIGNDAEIPLGSFLGQTVLAATATSAHTSTPAVTATPALVMLGTWSCSTDKGNLLITVFHNDSLNTIGQIVLDNPGQYAYDTGRINLPITDGAFAYDGMLKGLDGPDKQFRFKGTADFESGVIQGEFTDETTTAFSCSKFGS